MTSSPVRLFRGVAYAEAVSYLLLLASVFLYRVLDGPRLIRPLGMVHGIIFLVFLILVLRIRESQAWGFWKTILVLFLSAVPLGGFWVGRDVDERRAASTA